MQAIIRLFFNQRNSRIKQVLTYCYDENMASNRHINFNFGTEKYDTVKLTSNGLAFESDNHAFCTLVPTTTSVAEPSTLLLIFVGLLSLFGVRTRNRAAR